MTQDADILYELRGLAGVRAVHEIVSSPDPEWPRLIVEMESFDAYELAVITCALIRALPGVDRSHVGVIYGDRMREIILPRARRLELSIEDASFAEYRARARAAVVPTKPMRHVQLYFDPFRPDLDFLLFRGNGLVPMRDPFRSPAPPAPLVVIIAHDAAFQAICSRISSHAYRIDWRDAALDLGVIEKNPHRIYIDEALAPTVLSWMKNERPLDLARTFIVCDDSGRDWLEEFVRSLGTGRVEVVTPDEIPDSLRQH